MVVAVYLFDVELHELRLILELAWIKLLVYEVYYHLAVGIVHIVVDDQLHSFDGHAAVTIKRDGLEISTLEQLSLLHGWNHRIHATYFDLNILLRQDLVSRHLF